MNGVVDLASRLFHNLLDQGLNPVSRFTHDSQALLDLLVCFHQLGKGSTVGLEVFAYGFRVFGIDIGISKSHLNLPGYFLSGLGIFIQSDGM